MTAEPAPLQPLAAPPASRSAPTRALPALHAWLWRLAPKHPLPMRAVFRDCWLVNFHMAPEVLAARLPSGIEPEVHRGRAWLSVVVAAMDDMRPTLAPRLLGVAFDQVVYRAVVSHRGRPGVFFLHTDANHRCYGWAGDLLTFFHFHHAQITLDRQGGRVRFAVRGSPAPAEAVFDHAVDPERLEGSAFPSLAEARPALVERFDAFSVHPRTETTHRVTVERGGWAVQVVGVKDAAFPWMDEHLPGAVLDSAFYAPAIPYRWSRLRPVDDHVTEPSAR